MREVQPIKLQVSPNPLVFHEFLWIIGLSSSAAVLMRSPEETWAVCIHGGSEEKTTGRESRRTVSFKGRKGRLCTRSSSLCWTCLLGVVLTASVQAHLELQCPRYSLRFLDPLGPKTHIFEPGMWAVFFPLRRRFVLRFHSSLSRVLMLADLRLTRHRLGCGLRKHLGKQVLMHMLDWQPVAKPFLSQRDTRVPKGWTGSELQLWPIFLNNVLVLYALIRSSILDARHWSMTPRGLCSLIL